ncbi:MAG: YfhO family protein [Chloroflexi bacterium]|nr:YfhO family protein [Chloroflexota bacterium]
MALLGLLLAAVAGLGLALTASDSVPATSFAAWAAACLAVGIALAVPRVRGLAAALALAVVVADLGTASATQLAEAMHEQGAYQLRKLDLASYYAAAPADRFLQEQARAAPARYFGFAQHVFGDVMPYTLRWTDPKIEALDANDRALLLDLDDIQGYNPVHLTRYGDYMAAVNGTSQDYHHADVLPSGIGSPLLDPLNARYLVLPATPASDQRPPDLTRPYPLVYQDATVQIRENPWALPRAWLVHDARQVEPGGALGLLAAGGVDPHTTALVEQSPPALAPATAAESVDWLRQDPDELVLRTDASAPALLVLSETYDPFWEATVDDQPAPVLVADHILRAVPVPAGQHTLRLRYAPPMMRLGVLTSGATLVVLAGALLSLSAGRRRRASAERRRSAD